MKLKRIFETSILDWPTVGDKLFKIFGLLSDQKLGKSLLRHVMNAEIHEDIPKLDKALSDIVSEINKLRKNLKVLR